MTEYQMTEYQMNKCQKLSDGINVLEKNVIEQKRERERKRAKPSDCQPIKIFKDQTSLKLRTKNGTDWTFENIKYEDNGIFNCSATATCNKFLKKEFKIDLNINESMEICRMSLSIYPDDNKKSFVRYYYSSISDIYVKEL